MGVGLHGYICSTRRGQRRTLTLLKLNLLMLLNGHVGLELTLGHLQEQNAFNSSSISMQVLSGMPQDRS